jgi:hypothetical protein
MAAAALLRRDVAPLICELSPRLARVSWSSLGLIRRAAMTRDREYGEPKVARAQNAQKGRVRKKAECGRGAEVACARYDGSRKDS